MKKALEILADLSRYAVGILFIFSGIVKANDPLGFSYKLEEYFSEFPELGFLHNFEGMFMFLHDWALPQAIFIVILEVVLGVAILVRWRVKLTSILLLILIVFFTILTFASAYFGIVKTCGCFGDAIPLTPWESFIKDVVLSVLILIIFWRRKQISLRETNVHDFVLTIIGLFILGKLCKGLEWWFPFWFTAGSFGIFYIIRLFDHIRAGFYATTLATLGMVWFTFYCYSYLPVKDFRAYAEGKSITEGMKDCMELGLPCPEEAAVYVVANKYSGEKVKMPSNEWMERRDTFDFVEATDEVVIIEAGYEAKITDFLIEDEFGMDLTEEILNDESYTFMLVSYNLETSTTQVLPKISELASELQKAGYRFVCVTASYPESAAEFKKKHSLSYPFLYADQIVLKTIIRSNPGLLMMQNGAVMGKWHHNDIPEMADLKEAYLPQATDSE